MKWTIAILTMEGRETDYERIMGMLAYQGGGGRDIEILVAAQPWSVAEKRQWCLDNAQGEYFNFIDDDDLIARDYIDRIYPLLDGVDYIGFRMQLFWDGRRMKPTFHSLRYPDWSEDENGYYRNVSHLNPIRTEIARQGRFEGGYGEDRRWAEQVSPKTEHFIDEPMYFYFYSPEHSRTSGDT